MNALRALIRQHRHLALALVVVAFCIKAVLPAGFMLSPSSNTVLTVTICTDGTGALRQMKLIIPSKPNGGGSSTDHAKKDGHCGFTSLFHAALGGADGVLQALAFAFILVLGFAPARVLPFAPALYLRPPLRGPPATV
ncbi:hypothetical protein EB810_11585 [Altererythrobacter sp. FM1]|uniref:DUF2946 domain-containing protein n=1 Tax=Tsuneonella flava TaxID=2055955 RepID=A0ABX7KBZ0_9SPHN|nr:DUF2946 family protein [Tsuneonella flava]QSB44681.1 hypothetical protein IDJ81_00300 [Tsuneonella flava]ROT93760.1 hypothetical protein EB810_11585 [Altererythrobacter sp. FM1]UBS33120.1 hypothetical protein LBX01_00300 [Altererythrobacter sp. N1]